MLPDSIFLFPLHQARVKVAVSMVGQELLQDSDMLPKEELGHSDRGMNRKNKSLPPKRKTKNVHDCGVNSVISQILVFSQEYTRGLGM